MRRRVRIIHPGSLPQTWHTVPSVLGSRHFPRAPWWMLWFIPSLLRIPSIALPCGMEQTLTHYGAVIACGTAILSRCTSSSIFPIESCRHRPADARIQAVERNADGSLHRAPSSSRTDESNPVTITKVDAEALRFFPGDRARPTRGLPAGGDMGASGVDDLIQLQQMRRERGSPMRDRLNPSFPRVAQDRT